MTLTKEMYEDFGRRNLPQIKTFIEKKRAGSQEKEICETIIRYLYERNTDPDIEVETRGYVMAIDVLGKCIEYGIPRRAIDRCLTDLENHHIIDKRRYLYPAKRKRPGPEKKRENVFYRLCLAYAGQQDWEKNYSDLLESFVKVADKMDVSLRLLENLKKTNAPAEFDEAVKATERSLGIKKHTNTIDSTSKDIIKSMVGHWKENARNAPSDPRIRTTEDILKSILDNRSIKNAKESAARAAQHKTEKEKIEADKRKLRRDLQVKRNKGYP